MKTPEYLMTEEAAVNELADFIEYHTGETLSPDEIQADYKQVVKALRLGVMVIDEQKTPSYTLQTPILTADGSRAALDDITFRTRISLGEKRELEKGLDITKERIRYQQKSLAWVIGQPLAMLEKINLANKFDYRVIEQLGSLFFN